MNDEKEIDFTYQKPEIQRGDWVYCPSIPGTGKVIDFSWPWYLPNKRLFLIEFQGKEYYLFENEVEQ